MKRAETFFSYSRANSDFALRLGRDLKAAGGSVWIDQIDIPAGARWDEVVESALEECSIFLVILSPESINSQNVKDEIGYAIDAGKRILPILIKACSIPLRLRRFQYVDFSNKPYMESLAETMRVLGIGYQQNIEKEGEVGISAPTPQPEALVKEVPPLPQAVKVPDNYRGTEQDALRKRVVNVKKVSKKKAAWMVPIAVAVIGALATIIAAAIQLQRDPASPSNTSEAVMETAEQAVQDLIAKEVRGQLQQDMALLQSVYAPTAKIVDHRGTLGDVGDDLVYEGWVEISQRYEEFFVYHWSELKLVGLTIQVSGEQATVTHNGAIIDGTFYEGRVVYTLEQIAGQWFITRLEYGN